jgi:hypothetical protein
VSWVTQVRGEGRSSTGREVAEEDTTPSGEEHGLQQRGRWWWICRGKGKGGREVDLRRLREVGIPLGFAGTLHILG